MNLSNLQNARARVGKYPEANCWGLTAFILGGRSRLYWMDGKLMEKRLHTRLRRLNRKPKRFRVGDVAAKVSVYFDIWSKTVPFCEELMHTAVYVGRGLWLHQTGWRGEVKLHKFETMRSCYKGETRYYRARSSQVSW